MIQHVFPCIVLVAAGDISNILQVHFPFSLHQAKSHEGSGKGIASLMKMLIQYLEDEIKHGIKDEVETQKEFEADMNIFNT